MRTWILAPDGIWAETTGRLVGCGPDPHRWDWPDVLADIAGVEADIAGPPLVLDRTDLTSVHGHIIDRWMANVIWSTLCTDRIERVTVIRMTPPASDAWLDAVAAWTGRRGTGVPPVAWEDRRARWMLWAHSTHADTPPLDGARVVVGAVQPAT